MKILVLKEKNPGENRVAITPELVSKYIKIGFEVLIENGAGDNSSISDANFQESGAIIIKDVSIAAKDADIILKVQSPTNEELNSLSKIKNGCAIVGMLNPYFEQDKINTYNSHKISAFAAELFPRITRAQAIDVLSSQSNLAGYRAVIEASYNLNSAMPMMMTAAGTVSPAKVLVIGAGVAGLQAIATAKRLGAVVSAFDVRAAAKEQVESLGGKFIEVEAEENLETKGGYAKEVSAEYKKKQEQAIFDNIIKQDIVITTALIPGKEAPKMINEEMVKQMKSGSVIVDMAAIMGGNCELTKPGELTEAHNVKIIGYDNMPSRIAGDSSKLYAKNLYNFVEMITDKEEKKIVIDLEDEIIQASLLTHNGEILKDFSK